jgi:hypothetical protein
MMATAPRLATILKHLSDWARRTPEEVPESLLELMRQSRELLGYLDDAVE